MRRCSWLPVAFALGTLGCPSLPPPASSTPVGDGLFAITCEGNRSKCYVEAGRVCPHSFEVRDTNDQRGQVVKANTNKATFAFNETSQTTVSSTPTYSGDMLVECKKPPTAISPAAPAAVPEPWKETFPRTVAGYEFGADQGQFSVACKNSHATPAVSEAGMTCPEGPAGLPFDVQSIVGTFCDAKLCELVMKVEGTQQTEARRVQALLEQKYGPSQPAGAFVSRCATEEQAFVSFQRAWRWGDEFATSSIAITFDCAAPAGPLAISVTYRDPKGEAMRAKEAEAQRKNF